jgi:hypothetical protein
MDSGAKKKGAGLEKDDYFTALLINTGINPGVNERLELKTSGFTRIPYNAGEERCNLATRPA